MEKYYRERHLTHNTIMIKGCETTSEGKKVSSPGEISRMSSGEGRDRKIQHDRGGGKLRPLWCGWKEKTPYRLRRKKDELKADCWKQAQTQFSEKPRHRNEKGFKGLGRGRKVEGKRVSPGATVRS